MKVRSRRIHLLFLTLYQYLSLRYIFWLLFVLFWYVCSYFVFRLMEICQRQEFFGNFSRLDFSCLLKNSKIFFKKRRIIIIRGARRRTSKKKVYWTWRESWFLILGWRSKYRLLNWESLSWFFVLLVSFWDQFFIIRLVCLTDGYGSIFDHRRSFFVSLNSHSLL